MAYRPAVCAVAMLVLAGCGGDGAGGAKPAVQVAKPTKPAPAATSVPPAAVHAAPAPAASPPRPPQAAVPATEAADPTALLEERLQAARTIRDVERMRVRDASPAVAAVAERVELAQMAVRQEELTDTGIAAARERLASAQVAYFQALGLLLVEREDLALAVRTRGEVAAERQRLETRRRDIDLQLVGAPPEAEALRRERDAIGQREIALMKADQQAEALLNPVERQLRQDQPTLTEAYRRRKDAEQGLGRAYAASPAAALQAQAERIEATTERVVDEAVARDAAASAAEADFRRLEREVQAADARAKADAAAPGR
jgi:hypothetical protein